MTTFVALSGFLGAGKTTTMTSAARRLRETGKRVAVITNDQGTELVDTAMAAGGLGSAVGEVTGGCFCCRFEDLVTVTTRLVEQENADVVIAEAVGSCTDLTATVIRPLVALHGDAFTVAPMTTIVDPLRYRRLLPELDRGDVGHDLAYLYGRQLADAAVIGVNKVDLLEDDEVAEIADSLSERFPHAEIVTYSASRGRLSSLLRAWTREHDADDADLEIDYQRYGAAEARLAWLNETLDMESVEDAFVPSAWVRTALEVVARHCGEAGYTVGHVKLTIEDGASSLVTKGSVIDADREPSVDFGGTFPVRHGRAVLNARVECDPEQLEEIARLAAYAADRAHGVRSRSAAQRSFRPGQPRPTHRMLSTAD